MAQKQDIQRWLSNYDAARKAKKRGIKEAAAIVNNTTAVLNAAKSTGLIDQRGYDERLKDYNDTISKLSKIPVTRNGMPLTKPNGKPLTHIEFVKNGVYTPTGDVAKTAQDLVERQQAAQRELDRPTPTVPLETLKNLGPASKEAFVNIPAGMQNFAAKFGSLGQTKTVIGEDGEPQVMIRPRVLSDPEGMSIADVPDFIPAEQYAKNIIVPETEAQAVGMEIGSGLGDLLMSPLNIAGIAGAGGLASKAVAKTGIKKLPGAAANVVQALPIAGGVATTILNDPKKNFMDPLLMATQNMPESPLTQRILEAESVAMEKAPLTRAGVNVVGSVFQAGAFGAKGFLNEGVASLKKGRDAIKQIKADQIAKATSAAQSGVATEAFKKYSAKSVAGAVLKSMDETGQIPANVMWAAANVFPTATKAVMSKVDPYDPKTKKGYMAPTPGEWLQTLAGAAILKPSEDSIIAKSAGVFGDFQLQSSAILEASHEQNGMLRGLFNDLPFLKTVQERTGLTKDESVAYLNLLFEKRNGRPITTLEDIALVKNMPENVPYGSMRLGKTWDERVYRGGTWDAELIKKITDSRKNNVRDVDENGMELPTQHESDMHELMGPFSAVSDATARRFSAEAYANLKKYMVGAKGESGDKALDDAQRAMRKLPVGQIVVSDGEGGFKRVGVDNNLLFAFDITGVDGEPLYTVDASTQSKARNPIDIEKIPGTIKGLSGDITWQNNIGGKQYVFKIRGIDTGGVYVTTRDASDTQARNTSTVLAGREDLLSILPEGAVRDRVMNTIESAMAAGGNELQDRVDRVVLKESQASADGADFESTIYIDNKKFAARLVGDERNVLWYQLPNGSVVNIPKTARGSKILYNKPREPLTGRTADARIYGWTATALDQVRQKSIPQYIDVLLDKNDASSLRRIYLTDTDRATLQRLKDNYLSEIEPARAAKSPDIDKVTKKYQDKILNRVLKMQRHGDDDTSYTYLGEDTPINIGDFVVVRSSKNRVTPLSVDARRAIVVSIGNEGIGVKLAGELDGPTVLVHKELLVPAKVEISSPDEIFNVTDAESVALRAAGPITGETAAQRKARVEAAQAAEQQRTAEAETKRKQVEVSEFMAQFDDPDDGFAAKSVRDLTSATTVEEATTVLRNIQSERAVTPRQYGEIVYRALRDVLNENQAPLIDAILSTPATDATNVSSVIRQNEAVKALARWIDEPGTMVLSDDATEVLFFSNPAPKTQLQRELNSTNVNVVASYALRTWKSGRLATHVKNILEANAAYMRLSPDTKDAFAKSVVNRSNQMSSIDLGLSSIIQRMPRQNDNTWSYVSKLSPEQQVELLVGITSDESFFSPDSPQNKSINEFNAAIIAIGGDADPARAVATVESYRDLVKQTTAVRKTAAQKMLGDSAKAYAESGSQNPDTISSAAVKYFVDNLPDGERVTFVESLLGGLSDNERSQIGDYFANTTKVNDDITLKDLMDFAKVNKITNLSRLQDALDSFGKAVQAQVAVKTAKGLVTDEGVAKPVSKDDELAAIQEYFDLITGDPEILDSKPILDVISKNRDQYVADYEQYGMQEFLGNLLGDLTEAFKSSSVTPAAIDAISAATHTSNVKAYADSVRAEMQNKSALTRNPVDASEMQFGAPAQERPLTERSSEGLKTTQQAVTKLAEIMADNGDEPTAATAVSKEQLDQTRQVVRDMATWLRSFGKIKLSAIDFPIPLPSDTNLRRTATLAGELTEAAKIKGENAAYRMGDDGRVVLTKYGATNRVGMAEVFKRTLGYDLEMVNVDDATKQLNDKLTTSISEDLALLWDMNARSYAMRVMDYELQYGNSDAADFYMRVLQAVRNSATDEKHISGLDVLIDYVRSNQSLVIRNGANAGKSIIESVFELRDVQFGRNLGEFLQTHRLAQLTNDFYSSNARLMAGGVDPSAFTPNSIIKASDAFIHMTFPESPQVGRRVLNMMIHLNRSRNKSRNAYSLAHEVYHGLIHTMPWKSKRDLAVDALDWAIGNYDALAKLGGDTSEIAKAKKGLAVEFEQYKKDEETLSPEEFDYKYNVDFANEDSITFTSPVINEVMVAYLTNMSLGKPAVYSKNFAFSPTATTVFKNVGNRLGIALKVLNEAMAFGAVDVAESNARSTRWTLGADTFYSEVNGEKVHTPLNKGWAVRFAIKDENDLSNLLIPLQTSEKGIFYAAGALTKTSRIELGRQAPIFNKIGNVSRFDATFTVEGAVFAPKESKQGEILQSATAVELASATDVQSRDMNNIRFARVDQLVDSNSKLEYVSVVEGKEVRKPLDINKGQFGYIVSMKDSNGKKFYYLMRDSALNAYGTRVSGNVNGFSARSAAVLYDLYGGAKKHVQSLSDIDNFSGQATSEAVLFANLNSEAGGLFGVMDRIPGRKINEENFNVAEVYRSQVNATEIIGKDGITNEMEWSAAIGEAMKDTTKPPEFIRSQMVALQGTFDSLRRSMFGGTEDGTALSTSSNKTNTTFYGMKDSNGLLSSPMTHLVGSANSDRRLNLRHGIANDLIGIIPDEADPAKFLGDLASVARTGSMQDVIKKVTALGVDAGEFEQILRQPIFNEREYSINEGFTAFKELMTNELPFGYNESVNGPIDGRAVYNYVNKLASTTDFTFTNTRNQNIIMSHIMKRFIDAYPETVTGGSMTTLLSKLSNPLGKDSTTYTTFVSFAQRLNADAAFRARALREWRNYDIVDVHRGRNETPWIILTEVGQAEKSATRQAVAGLTGSDKLKTYYAVNPDDGRVVLAEKTVDDKWVFKTNPDITKEGQSLYSATKMISDAPGKRNITDDEKLFGIAVEDPKTGKTSYRNFSYLTMTPDPEPIPGSTTVGKFLDADNVAVQSSMSLKTIAAALKSTQDATKPNSVIVTIPLPHTNSYVNGSVDIASKFGSFRDVIAATSQASSAENVSLRTLEITWQPKKNRWQITDKGIPFTEDVAAGRKLQLADVMNSSKGSNELGISLPEVHIAKILAEKVMMGDKENPIYKKMQSVTGSQGAKRTIAKKMEDKSEPWGRTLFSEGLNQRDIDALLADPSVENVTKAIENLADPENKLDVASIVDEDPTMPEGRAVVEADESGVVRIKASTKVASALKTGAAWAGHGVVELDSVVRIMKLSRDLSAMSNQSYLNANWATDIGALMTGKRPEMITSLVALMAMAPNMPNLKQSVSNPMHALGQFGGTAFGDKMAHLAVEKVISGYADITLEDLQNFGLNLEYLKHYDAYKEALMYDPTLEKTDIPLNLRFDDMLGEGRATAIAKKFLPFVNQFERTNTLYRDLAKVVAFQNAHKEIMQAAPPRNYAGTAKHWRNTVLQDIAWSINFLGGNDGGEFSSNKNMQYVQSKFAKLFMSAPYAKTRMVLNPVIGPTLWGAKELVNRVANAAGKPDLINTATERKVWGRDLDSYARVYIQKKFYQGYLAATVMPFTLKLMKALAYGKAAAFVLGGDDTEEGSIVLETIEDTLQGMMTFKHNGQVYSSSLPGALGRITRQAFKPFKTQGATMEGLGDFYVKQYFENSLGPLASILKEAGTGRDYDNRSAFENSEGYRELRKYLLKYYEDTPVVGNILKMAPEEMSRFATELFFTINELSAIKTIENKIDIQKLMFNEKQYVGSDKDFEALPSMLSANLIGLNMNVQTENEQRFLNERADDITNRTRLQNIYKNGKYRNIVDVMREEGMTGVMSGYGRRGALK
jgi:hypothetical protein